MDSKVMSTIQSITSPAEVRETNKMLMQPNANWEEYLTPAPLSICIMAELVFISSGTDFSINKNPPEGGFKYIRYPESFRASLTQVANLGWHAFNEADKNMDKIRIHTAMVPDYIKAAIKILFHGSDEVIKTLLPNQLENIRTIADECVTLATNVEKTYTDVINLIGELLEACVNAEHFYGEELEKVKMKLEENKVREKAAQELKEWSKKAMEDMSKRLGEASDEYKKAMDSLPSGWDMIGMDCVQALTSSLTGAAQAYISKSIGAGGAPTDNDNKSKNDDMFTQTQVFSKSKVILTYAQSLQQFVNKAEIDWKQLYDQKNKSVKTNWTQDRFKDISEELGKMDDSEVGKHVLSVCQRAINICDDLAKYSPGKPLNEGMTKQLVEEVQRLNDDALSFDQQSKRTFGSPAESKPPNLSKAEKTSSGGSASQRAMENARYRIETSQDQLKQAREDYEKSVENMKKNQKELTEILVEMQNCNIKEIEFDTTIKMLVKGLDAMGRVKEQWEKMVRFFQMVSTIVQASLSKTLHNFVKTTDDTSKLSYNGKLFTKDILYEQANQASNIASLVHMISGTYCEVSKKYLMDRVSSLGKIIAMDKEKPEFEQERLNLQQSCKQAQEGILQLVLKNKKEFEMKTSARIAKMESDLKAILPPDELQSIENGPDDMDEFTKGM